MIFLYRPQTQYENLGDALIAKNLLEILENYGEKLTFGRIIWLKSATN